MVSSNSWWKGKKASEISLELYAAVKAAFPSPQWIVLEEISIPGSNGSRRADIVALSIWGPTRVVVCEIKASRADFLNEIRDPSKRERGVSFGTEFVFVVPHNMVRVDEVPEGCGLYEVQRNRRLKRTKSGTQKKNVGWTQAVFHNFVRAIVYRKDEAHRAFYEAGNQGTKIYKNLFKALGQEWSLEELLDLTKTLYRGLLFKKSDVEQASMDFRARMNQDNEVIRLRDLESTVCDLCGYGIRTGQDFARWFSKRGTLGNPDDRRDFYEIESAYRALSNIIKRRNELKKRRN